MKWSRLEIREGILLRRHQDPGTGLIYHQILVPQGEAQSLWEEFHQQAGHLNHEKISTTLRTRFFWPGTSKDGGTWGAECLQWLLNKTGPKYGIAVPTRDQSAITTAKVVWTHLFQVFGCPERIHSDRGAAFESALFRQLCQLYGGSRSHTTLYHPQGKLRL